MLGKRCAERAAADNDEVERPQITAGGQTGGGAGIRVDGDERFVKGVADVTPKHVASKRGGFGRERHGYLLLCSIPLRTSRDT